MQSVERIEYHRRRTGAGQGGGDLAADVSRFSHANDNDFAARFHAILDQGNRARKIFVEPLAQALELKDLDIENAAGFFEGGSTSFWIVKKKKPVQPIHVALRAPSKEAVHQFHSAALKAGAKDNGPPGFRRQYGDDYYAAFVLDFDGNNIEACYFGEKAPPE